MTMRILEPHQLTNIKQQRPKRRRVRSFLLFLMIFLATGYGATLYLLPLPAISPIVKAWPVEPDSGVAIPWPAIGQGAIGAKGYNVLAETNIQKPVPMASVAKVFTALMILKQKPLKIGEQGPQITVTLRDVDIYNRYVAIDGSVVPVAADQKLSEYQALQALLIPSANNVADMLAIWAYGSLADYVTAANDYAAALGLKQTHIADASGFSPETTSTAHDVVLLGQEALNNPVISQIVDTPSTGFPLAGTIYNTNSLISEPGVVGIKTGHTDEAGGCYLFAAKHQVAPDTTVTVIGAVLGAQDIRTAITSAPPILEASYKGFSYKSLVKKGQIVGSYIVPWSSAPIEVVAADDISALVWNGDLPNITAALNPLHLENYSSNIGNVSANADYVHKSVPVALNGQVPQPTASWRLRRFF